MHDAFDFLLPLALVGLVATLGVGLYSLFRGGDFARSYSNKLMRLRVAMQFVVILILVAAYVWRTHLH